MALAAYVLLRLAERASEGFLASWFHERPWVFLILAAGFLFACVRVCLQVRASAPPGSKSWRPVIPFAIFTVILSSMAVGIWLVPGSVTAWEWVCLEVFASAVTLGCGVLTTLLWLHHVRGPGRATGGTGAGGAAPRPGEYAHLQRIIDELERHGNPPTHGGIRPNQGGFACYMSGPLNLELVTALVAEDPYRDQIGVRSDEVSCLHCWTAIYPPL